jgi:beta-N-acetylhexosaminidase
MKNVARQLVLLSLVVALVLGYVPALTAHAQERDDVARLMERMSTAAKVGQLFVVTFPGSQVTEDAVIAELIRDYHVGGVVLKPENGNIANQGDTTEQVATLVTQLQDTAWQATRPLTGTVSNPFIPLFVAVNQEGNGLPHTAIVSGTTPLPSQMALGATWDISHTITVGQIVGQELQALGINMLLGPSLDVLENPRPGSSGDLGVRTFGGEPFWVGKMGKAYIHGVHEGAGGRVAVVPKHFPGLGSSDRSLDEELSTVQRTLEKLKQVDLTPFFAVAQAEDPLARPEGVLVSHIRFQGLGGGRFITTLPISVDSNVLQQLLSLPEMSSWREAGGVTLSDALGLRALRRFYAPGEQAFNGRRIAQDAFLAGNDLLYLSQFGLSGEWEDQMANIASTITFFREKYESEPSFQKQVDQAVARILRLKLSLHGGAFSLEETKPDIGTAPAGVSPEATETAEEPASQPGLEPDMEAVSAIARDAITLLSPPSPDLVPAPPTREDRIVIFIDTREERPSIDPGALEEALVQFYGPDATSQVDPRLIASFTFGELEAYLNAPAAEAPAEEVEPSPTSTPPAGITPSGESVTPTVAVATATPAPPSVGSALVDADWVIFGMLNPNDGPPQAGVVKRFLAERADALQDPHVVVMAYDVPYCLDATEISKLSAYYAAYSHLTPFVKASVRALFGEFAPQGDPPVSISGINYDLLTQTSPDPEQTIPVSYSVIKPAGEEEGAPTPSAQEPAEQPTAEPTGEAQPTPGAAAAETRLEKGDQLRLRTERIVDHNGHVVPDGTPVQFIFTYPQEGLEQSMLATTREGVAEAVTTLDRTGRLDISIQADPVPRKVALQITIQEGGAATVVTPTPSPTPLPTPTPTPTATPLGGPATPTPRLDATPTEAGSGAGAEGGSPAVTPAATRDAVVDEPEPPSGQGARLWDLLVALVGATVVAGAAYYAMRLGQRSVVRALRVALWSVVGGLAVYVMYVVSLSYLGLFEGQREAWGLALAGGAALAGSSVALLFAWLADAGHTRAAPP